MVSMEQNRLHEARENSQPWYRWGPYLSERQWGTVREDYSPDGTAWDFLPHEQARSHTYRWGEDGLLGICDDQGLLCFALSLWNEADPILKERLFGLTNSEGNHGEDVKEYYFFLDNTPTHSYMKALYKYPQRAFPYNDLVATNRQRSRTEGEYELIDTGIFAENRYFDVFVEYAKADPQDIAIRITVINRGPQVAPLHVLPTLWYRNTWAWGRDDSRPQITTSPTNDTRQVRAIHQELGEYWLACEGMPTLLFTENETNARKLWGVANRAPFVKDGINDTIVNGATGLVNPHGVGTKVAAHYQLFIEPGETKSILLRLSAQRHDEPFANLAALFTTRQEEADQFYNPLGVNLSVDERSVQRQALAGLLWSKQFYYYDVYQWLQGDPAGPPPPPQRSRNSGWQHLSNADVISMPDTWEYPWYAAWDLAFHCAAFALVDIHFAKKQLLLLVDKGYMHPNGQLPAYEWAFGDVNPPVHAWAAWHVYKHEKETTGQPDTAFLERIFHKLMLNFAWWVNRKDQGDNNIFEGGFLGLDNIGVFDRNIALPEGIILEQSDGTAWMAMFCLTMLTIAVELARKDPVYEDIAIKFLEHFMYIADAINGAADGSIGLWDEQDAFFYDRLCLPDNTRLSLKVRTLTGFIPLLAVETFDPATLESFPDLGENLAWFVRNRPYIPRILAYWQDPTMHTKPNKILALVRGTRLKGILKRMLDPNEFLSDYGIRSISKYHAEHPYMFNARGTELSVSYEPGESTTGAFGGNSNWRGPIWFPINFLLIEALQKFYQFYGDDFLVEYPTGSGIQRTLRQIADDLSHRLTKIFLRDGQGCRPVFGTNTIFQNDPYWHDALPFHEYFHGDTGKGLGASHQTGWTAVVANLLAQGREK